VTFGVQSIPRGRDVREAVPQVGVALADYAVASSIDDDPVPGVAVLLEPHCSYAIEGYLLYATDATAEIRAQLTAPQFAVGFWGRVSLSPLAAGNPGAARGGAVRWRQELFDQPHCTLGGAGAAVPLTALLIGSISTGAFGGALQLCVSQSVSTAAITTVYLGSWIAATKIEED
jgi:hypothetical protein